MDIVSEKIKNGRLRENLPRINYAHPLCIIHLTELIESKNIQQRKHVFDLNNISNVSILFESHTLYT